MNSRDEDQNNYQDKAHQGRKGAKEHLADLRNAITPSALTFGATVAGVLFGGLHGGVHRLLRWGGTGLANYILENAPEFKNAVYKTGHAAADAAAGYQLQRGWRLPNTPLSGRESLAFTLAYLYVSGMGMNLLKQIASLPTDAAGLWDEVTLNNIVTKSPIFLAVGLAASYGLNLKTTIEAKEEQPLNVHDLFENGINEYEGQLTRYLASLVAKGKGLQMPEAFTDTKFFEQHGVADLANDIIQAGKSNLEKDLHKRLQSFIKTVNQTGAISKDDESYPTVTEYLEDYEPLTAYLRNTHPEVILQQEQEQLEGAVKSITAVAKKRKIASDSEISEMMESRRESAKLLVNFDEVRKELEKVNAQRLDDQSNLKIIEKLTTLIDYSLAFHNKTKESTRKIIRGYIASLPTMKDLAEETGKALRDLEWEPLGVNHHKARTNFNILSRPAGGACLTRSIDANPITGQAQVLKVVTADKSQIAAGADAALRSSGQGYIKRNEKGAIELSHERTPRKVVWAELMGEMNELETSTKHLVQSVERRMMEERANTAASGEATDELLQSLKAMEAELASLSKNITEVEQEIENVFARYKDKTKNVIEQYKKAKTVANESRQLLRNTAQELKNQRHDREIANVASDMMMLAHKYDSEIDRVVTQKLDGMLADENGRWMTGKFTILPTVIARGNHVHDGDMRQALRSSDFDLALQECKTCIKYQERLLEYYKDSPKSKKKAQDDYAYYKNIAVNCHVQSALKKIESIDTANIEVAEQLVNLKKSLQLISDTLRRHIISFGDEGQLFTLRRERMPKTKKTIFEALWKASAILSKDCDALYGKVSSDAAKAVLHEIAQHTRDAHAQLNDALRLHDSIVVKPRLQSRLLRVFRLDKFADPQTSKVDIEARLKAAEAIDSSHVEGEASLESTQSNISPEEKKQLKAKRKKERKAAKASASEGQPPSPVETTEQTIPISAVPVEKPREDISRRQKKPIATESDEQRQERFTQIRGEITELEDQLSQQKQDFDELETEFLTLKNVPSYRSSFSKEDLKEKATAYRDASVTMVDLYSQLSAKHTVLIEQFPENTVSLNLAIKARGYRSEREPYKSKAREGDALAATWYHEKAKADMQEIKAQLAIRPTEALLDLLPDEEIISVTSTVGKWHDELLDSDKKRAQSQLAEKQGISLTDYQAQFTGEYGSKNESLYDHLIKKAILLKAEDGQDPVQIKGHDHYPLPDMDYIPVVDLIEKHQGNRTFCSLQSRFFADLGRAQRESQGLTGLHGELSKRTVQRLERLEVVTTLLNNPQKFGLGPLEIAFIEKARTDKNVLSPQIVVDLLTIVHRHAERGCKIHLWEPAHLPAKQPENASDKIDRSDFLNGRVAGVDPHNDLCLINKTGGIMEPKLSGSQEYFLAKKSVFGRVAIGDQVSSAKGQIKKNGMEIGAPVAATVQSQGAKQGAKRRNG